jgi:hypothetical protein
MSDICVICPKDEGTHLIEDKLEPDEGYAWWEMGRLPRGVHPGDLIFFQLDGMVVGCAEIKYVELGRIEWECIDAVVFEEPFDPGTQRVTRGFRYVSFELAEEDHPSTHRDRIEREDEERDGWLWDQTFGAALDDELEELF